MVIKEKDATETPQKKYIKTEKGKIALTRYFKSDKAKKTVKEYQESESGRRAKLRYMMSKKGHEAYGKQLNRQRLMSSCQKWLREHPGLTPTDFFNSLNNNPTPTHKE